jgi:hypothetical protein
MKTLWDLIQEWKSVRADAERIEVLASKTRQQANALEARLLDALMQHGPVMACSDLYLPPSHPSDPIRIQRVLDAMSIVLPETTNPKGGAA